MTMAYQSEYSGPQIDMAVRKSHITGSTDPTTNTVGVLGQRYFNTTTGATFECTETITVDEVTTYTWRPVIANSLTETVAGQALDATKGKALADLISTHTADLITDADGAHGLKIESGTWTPTIVSSGGGEPTYDAINNGSYVKINNVVHLQATVALATLGTLAAGSLTIEGLPFAISGAVIGDKAVANIGASYNVALGTALQINGTGSRGTSKIALLVQNATTTVSMALSNITATTAIYLSMEYKA
jgi:hypothetical protein